MTAKELLAKNAAIKLAKEKAKQEQKQAVACDECRIVKEESAENTTKKKRGKRPATREYMVVDDEGIKEEDKEQEQEVVATDSVVNFEE